MAKKPTKQAGQPARKAAKKAATAARRASGATGAKMSGASTRTKSAAPKAKRPAAAARGSAKAAAPRKDAPRASAKSTKSAKRPVKAPVEKKVRVAADQPRAPRKVVPPPMPHLEDTSNGDDVVLAAPIESPLNARERDQFRQMLLEKRAEILGNVSTLHREAVNKDRADAAGDVSSMPIHMADLGTDNYELEFTLGLIEGERAILREIDEALERLDKGTYGVCLATGKPIGRARLKAKPWAKYCYEYTLAQEKGQMRRF